MSKSSNLPRKEVAWQLGVDHFLQYFLIAAQPYTWGRAISRPGTDVFNR